MESKRKIMVRYRRGEGIRAISRALNISRNTARSIIRSQGNIKSEYTRTTQPSPKLGAYIEKLEKPTNLIGVRKKLYYQRRLLALR